MANKTFRELLGEIKQSQDIVDYIQSSAVALKSSSGGKFKGLCPFHGEKSPSFYVDSNFQNYRCFGCGANGDILSFVQEYENLSFIDSVKKLAELSGIDAEIEDSEPGVDLRAVRSCVAATHDFFLKAFEELPRDHRAKQEVLEVRGLELDSADYGYAPEARNSLYKHLKKKGFSDEIMLQAGVASRWEKDGKVSMSDFWNGRLMFTMRDATGKPVGFSGRHLFDWDKRAKYVNSPDGPVFDKGALLFHQSDAKQEAKKTGRLYVAEGQFDVTAIDASGMANVVASSGTAFTRKQVLMCSRMVGEAGKVIFTFDGDAAGQKAAYKVFALAEELQSQCYVVSLPKDQDPCDFRKEHGPEALREELEGAAVPIVEFVLGVIAGRYDLEDPAQASRYLDEIAVVLKGVSNQSLRATYAKRVALKSFMSISTVEEAIANAKASKDLPQRARPKGAEDEEAEEKPDVRRSMLSRSEKEEKYLESLEGSELKGIQARILQLALRQRSLLKPLVEAEDYPNPLKAIAKEVARLPESSPIIFENSKAPLILEYVISQEYFPFLNVMDEEDIEDLFHSLFEDMRSLESSRELKRKARKIMDVLQESSDPELLRVAAEVNDHG